MGSLTYQELTDRTRRFAHALAARGYGAHTERDALAGHESGQDHLAIYLHNGPEYLEAMLGSFKARLAPFNVNYRYVAEELQYLLDNAQAKVVVYHDAFAPTLAEVLPLLPSVTLLVQVPDDSGNALLPDAVRYDDLLAEGSTDPVDLTWSPDDLYILYTGGTTGMPKGVLWRQHDIFIGAMGGRPVRPAHRLRVARGDRGGLGQRRRRHDVGRPADARRRPVGHLHRLHQRQHGGLPRAHHPPRPGRHLVDGGEAPGADPADRGRRHGPPADRRARAHVLRPLRPPRPGQRRRALNSTLKERFLEQVPHAIVLDAVGSSETGAQMGHTSAKGAAATGTFTPGPETSVVSADLSSSSPPAARRPAGWPSGATCRSATWAMPPRPRPPSP